MYSSLERSVSLQNMVCHIKNSNCFPIDLLLLQKRWPYGNAFVFMISINLVVVLTFFLEISGKPENKSFPVTEATIT